MSFETRRYNIAKPTQKMLGVFHCGVTVTHSGHTTRSLLPTYSAHFIISGKGTYTVNGKEYRLHAGQGFMLYPFSACKYISDENDPWTYIFASFDGAGDDELVASVGINESELAFSFENAPDAIENIKKMLAEAEKESVNNLAVTSYFLLAFSGIAGLESNCGKATFTDKEYIGKVFDFVKNNYPYKITVNDIAKSIGIDRSYLHRLFKCATGISPEKYIVLYRLEKAKAMLMRSDGTSLTDIAIANGFYDVSHFSKVFTEKYGITPGNYIKERKK